jgi:hypothetical protein
VPSVNTSHAAASSSHSVGPGGMGSRVQGLRFWVRRHSELGLGARVQDLGFRVKDFGVGTYRLRVEGSGLGFRV